MTNTASISIKSLKACNVCSSKEQIRYYLNGVLVVVAPRHSTYVATDGHRMLVHRENLADGAEPNTLLGEWIVPAETIAKFKAGRRVQDEILLTQLADGKFLLANDEDEIIFKPIDGTFPDWRRVIPVAVDAEKGNERPQFNLAYAADFRKIAKLLDYSENSPHFHYGRASDPCAVTFGHENTFGVLMPVRNNAPLWNGAPGWVNENPALAAAAE